MNSPPSPADDAKLRLEQAALYYAGALPADEAAQFEAVLREADDQFLAACRQLESLSLALVESIPAAPPPADIRSKLLRRTADPVLRSDSPELERAGIFIRRYSDQDWHQHRVPGVRFRYLYVDRARKTKTILLRCEPGAKFPDHDHRGPEESLVLEGDLRVGDVVLGVGDYQRCEPGSHHMEQSTETGCLLLVTVPLD